jgi:dual specificity tyrosine-phosphorylation-regulated kinase 2/3/4
VICDELESLPVAPGQLFPIPSTPSFIYANFRDYLTDPEEIEIMKYHAVYYLRQSPPSSKQVSRRPSRFFRFVKSDHIAYRYEQVRVLGKGSFASVIECIDHKSNEHVAIKLIRDRRKLHSGIIFELDLLKGLQSDNNHIVRYVESFSFRKFFCIVMELVSVDLFSALRLQRFTGFKPAIIQMVAREVATALKHTHAHGIIHCDIKPENILFSDKQRSSIRVIDVGCSCFIGNLLFSYIQSRFYRAPEVILGTQYGPEIDIWSLGCVLCELVNGKPIFPAENEDELIQMIAEVVGPPPIALAKSVPRGSHFFNREGEIVVKANSKGKYHTPGGSSIMSEVKYADRSFVELIEGCLRWDPHERLTAGEVLGNEWVNRKFVEKVQAPQTARMSSRRFD